MKKRIWLILSLLIILFTSGCFNKDQKAEELINYYNDWLEINESQPKSSVLLNFRNEDDEELLSYFEKRVKYLEELELNHKGVKKLKDLSLKLERERLEYLDEYRDTIFDDVTSVDEARIDKELAELESMHSEFEEERDRLMEKYKVYWIIIYDDYGNELERVGTDR